MARSRASRFARPFESFCHQVLQQEGLPQSPILTPEQLQTAFDEEKVTWRQSAYTPILTFWAFVTQCLDADGSCRQAVARLLGWLVRLGARPISPKTDPYCKARQRLPVSLFPRLVRQTGTNLAGQSPEPWLWRGRPVKVVDGSTATMPDTPDLQRAFPQHGNQTPGLGFPIARIAVLFCLSCGAVLDAALGRFQGKTTSEKGLFRGLLDSLRAGDVLLGDRYYGTFGDLAQMLQRQADGVFRVHQRRRVDFRRGRRVGRYDCVQVWERGPFHRPMERSEYDALPESLTVRLVRVSVHQQGFRTRSLDLVTTLLEAKAYPKADLAALYRRRWQAELNLRTLKGPLGLDVLRCQSESMVVKEFWARLLGYNLVRAAMAQAARAAGVKPWAISFCGALQTLRAFGEMLRDAPSEDRAKIVEVILRFIAGHRVGDRPDRIEPRAVKRRPKHYPILKKPRPIARNCYR